MLDAFVADITIINFANFTCSFAHASECEIFFVKLLRCSVIGNILLQISDSIGHEIEATKMISDVSTGKDNSWYTNNSLLTSKGTSVFI